MGKPLILETIGPFPPAPKHGWGSRPYKRYVGNVWRIELLMMGANGRPEVMDSPNSGLTYIDLFFCPVCEAEFEYDTDYRGHWREQHDV